MIVCGLTEQKSLRVRLLSIDPDLVLSLLMVPEGGSIVDGKKIECIKDRIPVTEKAVRCGISDRGDIQIVITDEAFEEIVEGMQIPQLIPTYTETEQ